MLTRISHALNAPTRYTRHALTRAFSATTSCMTSSSIPRSDLFVQSTRFNLDWPENLTRFEPPEIIFKKKVRKKKCFDQTNLWLWPKSQNFQKGLVPFYLSRTFQFWNLFLCSRLGNCANCPNSKKLTFGQILTKKSKFSRRTYLAQFFAKILIFESISSFENPKLLKKCDSATVGFNVNLDQESRSPSKACPIQTFI